MIYNYKNDKIMRDYQTFKTLFLSRTQVNKMGACFNPKQIWEYRHHFHRYYRIEFESGELKEYDQNY